MTDLSRLLEPADTQGLKTVIRPMSQAEIETMRAERNLERKAEKRAELEVQLHQYLMEDDVLDRAISNATSREKREDLMA